MTSLFDLSGRTALVTGASRGIGRAIATGLAAAGAHVALNGRDAATLDEVRTEIEAASGRAVVVPADVTEPAAVQAMVVAVIETLGHLDIVVNNAGGTAFMVPFADLRFEGWTKVMRLNTESVVHVCQAVAPHLLERRRGSVINVASVAALGGTPTLSPYGASKAAVLSLTRSLAMEWGHAGVRVNALCPGWTATDLNRNLWQDEHISAAMTATIPLGRWGRAEEMTGAAVFLASDASSYLTGQAIVVDGGLTAR
ncbi:MAG: SDR family oxidoreductase [Actinomycetota bacterium]|nr:SDR family oxidoreductase [Actinomycetota bacterium]